MNPVPLPPPVEAGATVGIAALSGPVDPERLARGIAALEGWGFRTALASNLEGRTERHPGLFAGTDAQRLEGFHRLAADPAVQAILFARGGWGALRVLPRVDWHLLARYPRAYVGYSDLTPLLNEIPRRLGFAAFHGPMVAADLARGLSSDEETAFLGGLAGHPPRYYPLGGFPRGGFARGVLAGGCLSLLTSCLGTPWTPRLGRALLFLEDTGEPLYRLDRMLTHLRLSGNLTRVRGVIFGHCRPTDESRADLPAWPMVVSEALDGFAWPIAVGLPAGHEAPNWMLPFGLAGTLDPQAHGLTLENGASGTRVR